MSLIKRTSNWGFPTLRNSISDLFDVEKFFDFNGFETRSLVPAVNVQESNDKFELEVAAPGLSKKDFNIEVANGVLNISCEKEETKEEKEKNFTRREFSYSSFQRSFTLPPNVNEDDIKAKYEDGLLKITLKKKEETKDDSTKKIDIL